jgi:hypothetical protein
VAEFQVRHRVLVDKGLVRMGQAEPTAAPAAAWRVVTEVEESQARPPDSGAQVDLADRVVAMARAARLQLVMVEPVASPAYHRAQEGWQVAHLAQEWEGQALLAVEGYLSRHRGRQSTLDLRLPPVAQILEEAERRQVAPHPD